VGGTSGDVELAILLCYMGQSVFHTVVVTITIGGGTRASHKLETLVLNNG
jgi:hypothetical protein